MLRYDTSSISRQKKKKRKGPNGPFLLCKAI
uniref:Uncharacterized protein n=1 Tax=Klebsiella phage JLBP1001 TaxID=3236746 RepID=A0AB39C8L0_9CAUD